MTIEAELEENADRPVSADKPCGEDLEDTQLLASFDAFRLLFGQSVPLPAETDWRDIKVKSSPKQSKKARTYAYWAIWRPQPCGLDGWAGFLGSVHVAAGWVKTYWADVYPHVDEDAILRKNALNNLADRMSVLDGLRRMPLVENRQLGRISLRDVDLATGQIQASESDTTPATEAQVAAVFAATATEALQGNKSKVETAIADLKAIDAAMRDFGGTAASPDFDPLVILLVKIDKLLGEQLTARGAKFGGRCYRRRIRGRRAGNRRRLDQIASRRHSGTRRDCAVLPAERTFEPDTNVFGTCEKTDRQGFPGNSRRRGAGRGGDCAQRGWPDGRVADGLRRLAVSVRQPY